jgi:hypothetical protein
MKLSSTIVKCDLGQEIKSMTWYKNTPHDKTIFIFKLKKLQENLTGGR